MINLNTETYPLFMVSGRHYLSVQRRFGSHFPRIIHLGTTHIRVENQTELIYAKNTEPFSMDTRTTPAHF